tara:strand:- start:15075 stop:15764 length:690 start_codon:yes stop_codon:yes gene_type:complete
MDTIIINSNTKDILFSILGPTKDFLNSEEKYNYEFAGYDRLDGKSGVGYIDNSIEPGAFKETFAFKFPSNNLYKKVSDEFIRIGKNYITSNYGEKFWKMHEENPLIRFHRYHIIEKKQNTNNDLRFFPHRDYGTFTFSYSYDDTRGMQWCYPHPNVYDINHDEWNDINYNTNNLNVMLGSIMKDFGFEPHYHRMINTDSHKERYSITCHFDLSQVFLGNTTIKQRLGIK